MIAGMGGPLMERILTDGEAVRESFREMILQPQSDIPHFRRFIKEIGWKIVEEEMILEDGKFYPMMKVIPGEKEHICAEDVYKRQLLHHRCRREAEPPEYSASAGLHARMSALLPMQ